MPLARLAIAPVTPADAAFAKRRPPSGSPVEMTSPTSMRRIGPSAIACNASFAFVGMSWLRMKSRPVPRAITPSAASPNGVPLAPTRPLTTSCTVPSPPTATTTSAPAMLASRASSVACPGASVRRSSTRRPRRCASATSSGHSCPVLPLAEAGLMIRTTRRVMRASAPRRGRRVRSVRRTERWCVAHRGSGAWLAR